MGVVDQHRNRPLGTDHFHPAGHRTGRSQPFCDPCLVYAQCTSDGRSHQGILHIEQSGQCQVDPVSPPGEPRGSDRQHHVGRLVPANDRRWDRAEAIQETPTPRVVGKHDSVTAALGKEQRRFRLEVLLHRSVMVEMIPAQVGECRDIEDDLVHSVLGQRMRRHLHCHGHPAVGYERCELALEIGRFGCRPGSFERADDPGRPPVGLQDRPHQMGHRGLAVRPGDSDGLQRPGRVAVEGSGHRCHRRSDAARCQHDLGHLEVDEVLAQQR